MRLKSGGGCGGTHSTGVSPPRERCGDRRALTHVHSDSGPEAPPPPRHWPWPPGSLPWQPRLSEPLASQTPGPAAYHQTDVQVTKLKAPQYTIAARVEPPGDKTLKPGPGAHSPEKVWEAEGCREEGGARETRPRLAGAGDGPVGWGQGCRPLTASPPPGDSDQALRPHRHLRHQTFRLHDPPDPAGGLAREGQGPGRTHPPRLAAGRSTLVWTIMTFFYASPFANCVPTYTINHGSICHGLVLG